MPARTEECCRSIFGTILPSLDDVKFPSPGLLSGHRLMHWCGCNDRVISQRSRTSTAETPRNSRLPKTCASETARTAWLAGRVVSLPNRNRIAVVAFAPVCAGPGSVSCIPGARMREGTGYRNIAWWKPEQRFHESIPQIGRDSDPEPEATTSLCNIRDSLG